MSLLKVLFFCGFVVAVYSKPNIESRIVGGTNAVIGEFPYQASLRLTDPLGLADPSHFCGGSIIGASAILTAGHCLCIEAITSGLPINLLGNKCNLVTEIVATTEIRVYINTIYLNSEGNEYKVKKVIQHPDFDLPTIQNDIGVILLRSAIPPTVPLISLASAVPADATTLQVSGWGLVIDDGSALPNNLQKLSATKYNTEDCKTALGASGVYVTERNVCTFNGKGRGVCNGDSGGPLAYLIDSIRKQIGIVSWGLEECAGGTPDVYTNVAAFCSWIQNTTGISCT